MRSYGEGCPGVEVFCKGEGAEVAFSGESERAAAAAASGESGLEGKAVTGEGVLGAEAVSGEGGRASEAVSGEGGGAVAVAGKDPPSPVSGEGGRAAEALSGEGCGAVAVSGKGKGKRKRDLLSSLEYPCTERFRFRRLLAFLRDYWFDETYYVAKKRMLVIFHTEDLVEKVKAGLWRQAVEYVRSFVPMTESSREADILSLFLHYLRGISGFADGNTMRAGIVCDWFARIYRDPHPVLDKHPFFATIVADVLFLRAEHLRNSLDWQLVRNKAALMVQDMAIRTPALRDRMIYPRGPNIIPFRSSFRQRHQVKNLGQKKSTGIAQFYLQLKKRLPSSSQPETHADYSDKALQAGRQYLPKEVFPLEAALTVKAIQDPFKQGQQLKYGNLLGPNFAASLQF